MQAKNISDMIMWGISRERLPTTSYKDMNSNKFFMINSKNEIMKIVLTDGQ
ncbi:hypothetical protein [Wolbachia endosymbiont of Litomosoides sigmodontis]|uniref:hypothetical protein n=1 Tax=Wolbachia endosymbiont of Litomosoides sigmodontis TaxID=80850 RepID=UPI00158D4BA2|nr:hypothetical protein [Wolbachia endosymbiont of Litomosoides sigmodontis]